MDFVVILAFVSATFAGGIALAVAWSGRRTAVHWSFVAGMVLLAAESVLSGLAADARTPEGVVGWQDWRLLTSSLLPGTWLLFSMIYARGDYDKSLARWRMPLVAFFIVPSALTLGFHGDLVFWRGSEQSDSALLRLGLPGFILNLILLVSMVLVLMNLERTYRASVGTMRWRIKFMVFGLGLIFGVRAYSASEALLFRAINPSLQALNCGTLLVGCVLMVRSLARDKFEVKVYPSPLILHRSLTVMLAGIYLLVVGVLAKIVVLLGGAHAFAAQAFLVLLALVGITLASTSDRLRLIGKRFLSRNFQRPQYDYRAVWRAFTEATARQVEQRDLCEAIVKLVSQLFQALSINFWLIDDRKETFEFAASTSLTMVKGGQLSLEPSDAQLVLAGLRAHPAPVDIDASKEIWAVVLRRLHPNEFRQGGNRVCVPLLAGNEFLGVITLGDRVAGVTYSLQDFDLLKCIADQAAASLLSVSLSQKLSQTKQLEAFQAMSTFFVHDLKNTASTLSLMLQNLPVHFNDPNFREDALRGISNTVTHINDLISRLSILRQDIAVQTFESDLNAVVNEALQGLGMVDGGPSFRLPEDPAARQEPRPTEGQASGLSAKARGDFKIAKDLGQVAKVRIDPVQMRNVVTNLVLNARDAVGPNGQIRVETSQRNGWVALAVADNGCGMSAEFVQGSLFRPFQTTKKKGIGIGMFQCKTIVEAHHGRIEVESQPGKGSTFRVLLPTGG